MKKVTLIIGLVCLALIQALPCRAQTPVNDKFTNATVLVGNNLIFTGGLTGSTAENMEADGTPTLPVAFGSTQHSVWWSWTAANDGQVTITALSYSRDTIYPSGGGPTFLAVYSITNEVAVVNSDGTRTYPSTVTATILDASVYKASISFLATASQTYQFQLGDFHSGASTLQMKFQLIASNAPVILDPPTDQTVAPGGSALFTVIADGVRPISYQWCSNGFAIAGAVYPMLALDSVTMDESASYDVVISNATGVVTSQVANLLVTTNAPYVSLSLAGVSSNGLTLSLTGDANRYWRIESSTDLVTWNAEGSFLTTPPNLDTNSVPPSFTSIVYTTNSTISVSIPAGPAVKFVRAHAYVAPNELCNSHLKRIRFGKLLFQRQFMYGRVFLAAETDLQPFGLDRSAFYCPVGGYDSEHIETLKADPYCSVSVHILEEPR
jgi:hypothetical protein